MTLYYQYLFLVTCCRLLYIHTLQQVKKNKKKIKVKKLIKETKKMKILKLLLNADIES